MFDELIDEPAADAQAQPTKSRAGRNLPAAIAVGLGLAAVIIPSLFVWRPSFAFIVAVIVLYGCYELARALGTTGIRVSLAPLMVGSAALLIAAWERGASGLVLGVLITLVAIVVWRIADGAYGYTRDVTATALTLLYLPALAAFAVLLVHPSDGAARVLAFAATVVCSDTGGYAAGVLFGKHPLAPVVSKAKTWEGFSGSPVACATCPVHDPVLSRGVVEGVAVRAGDRGHRHGGRPGRVDDQERPRPQGHGQPAARTRRRDGPARLHAAVRGRGVLPLSSAFAPV